MGRILFCHYLNRHSQIVYQSDDTVRHVLSLRELASVIEEYIENIFLISILIGQSKYIYLFSDHISQFPQCMIKISTEGVRSGSEAARGGEGKFV